MSIGSAIGPSNGRSIGSAIAGGASWSPLSLFAAGEKGVWFDPSDFSSMFQDSAGTTPVTAVEQPVGLVLDKSQGLIEGAEEIIDPGFDDTSKWTNDSPWAVSGGVATHNGTAAGYIRTGTEAPIVGNWYKVTIVVSAFAAGSALTVYLGQTPAVYYITAVGTYTIIGRCPGTGLKFSMRGSNSTGLTTVVESFSVRSLSGYGHALQATAGSRPLLQQDGAGKYYLDFDGTDDSLATAAIDFTATDKMTVCTGVRKDSDAAQGCIAELTASVAANNGAWLLAAPDAADATFAFDSKGTSQVDAVVSGNAAPMTAVLTGLSDISGDSCAMRVNGVLGDTDVGDQGTGNYSNAALYIGRRAGVSLPFNGRIYQLVVRGAATASLTELETYVNSKTGAY